MANFKIDGVAGNKSGRPAMVRIESDRFDTLDQAQAVAARFPKYLRVYATKMYSAEPGGQAKGHIRVRIELAPDGVNDGKNEAGIKRFLKILEKLDRFGHTTEWPPGYVTSYTDLDEFLHALDG